MNDKNTIVKLLRAMASGTDAQRNMHSLILHTAANMLETRTGTGDVPKDRPVLVQDICGTWHHVQWHEDDQNEFLDWIHRPHWSYGGNYFKPDTEWKAWAELPEAA